MKTFFMASSNLSLLGITKVSVSMGPKKPKQTLVLKRG